MDTTVSRRTFVTGAAAAAVATAAAGVAAARADEAAAQDAVPPQWVAEVPETWDREAEVLVLGCGIAGACATVEAADLGASVITVDAAAEVTDCSCTLSGGWVCGCNTLLQEEEGIEDSVDVFVSDMRRDGGDAGDPDVIRAWAEISGETVDWLWDLGCDVVERTYDARTTAGSDAHSVAREQRRERGDDKGCCERRPWPGVFGLVRVVHGRPSCRLPACRPYAIGSRGARQAGLPKRHCQCGNESPFANLCAVGLSSIS